MPKRDQSDIEVGSQSVLEMQSLAEAFATRYPNIPKSELELIVSHVLAKITRAIREGDQVAILKKLPGNKIGISYSLIEEAVTEATGQMRKR